MSKRLRSFKACISELGGSAEWWRLQRISDRDNFPKPINGLWDFNSLAKYIDNFNDLKPKSSEPDYETLFKEDLHGRDKGGLPYTPRP